VTDFLFLGSKITADGDFSHEIRRQLLLGRKATTNLGSILKSRDVTLLTKFHTVNAMVFPVVMYECENWTIRGWALKNWCFRTVVLEKIRENPLDSKEIKLVNPKENQLWIFIGRTDAKAPILWPPDDRGWDGWMVSLDGCEFEQTLGDTEGQGSLCAAVHGVAKSRTQLSNWMTWS